MGCVPGSKRAAHETQLCPASLMINEVPLIQFLEVQILFDQDRSLQNLCECTQRMPHRCPEMPWRYSGALPYLSEEETCQFMHHDLHLESAQEQFKLWAHFTDTYSGS